MGEYFTREENQGQFHRKMAEKRVFFIPAAHIDRKFSSMSIHNSILTHLAQFYYKLFLCALELLYLSLNTFSLDFHKTITFLK